MSADIRIVDGYGIDATDLKWKSDEEIEMILEGTGGFEDIRDYLDNASPIYLEYARVNESIYVYVSNTFPLVDNNDRLLTKETIATEINEKINQFLEEEVTFEQIMSMLGGVFNWEIC